MKIILFLTVLLISFVNLTAQMPCGNLENQPGKWVQIPTTGKNLLAIKTVNSAMSLFQKSVAGFTGGQAKIYTFTADWVDTRPYKYEGYTVAMNFLAFECVYGKIKPEAATGTWAYIGFNEIPFFRGNNRIGDFFQLPNGQQMFFSKYKFDGKFKGLNRLVPLHDLEAEAVFLSRSNRLPLRVVSQADVLIAYKKFFASKKETEIKRLEVIIAKEPADIARIDNDKITTNKEQNKQSLIEGNNRVRGYLAQFTKELAVCNSTIDTYLTKPIASQPAIIEGIDEYCNPEKMFAPRSNAKQIVVFDEVYFNKSLPSGSPQFIVVYWRKGDANAKNNDGSNRFPSKQEFIRKFEENFDFEFLQKMLETAA